MAMSWIKKVFSRNGGKNEQLIPVERVMSQRIQVSLIRTYDAFASHANKGGQREAAECIPKDHYARVRCLQQGAFD